MFEAKLNENGLGSEYAEDKKYINALKGLDEKRVANFRLESVKLLSEVRDFITAVLTKLESTYQNEPYNKDEFLHIVYELYFQYNSSNGNNTYFKEVLKNILDIVKISDNIETQKKHIRLFLKGVNELVDSFAVDHYLLFEDGLIPKEKYDSENYKEMEKLYGCYQELKEVFESIKKYIPSNTNLIDFITSYRELSKKMHYKDFYDFAVMPYRKDGCDLTLERKDLKSLEDSMDSIRVEFEEYDFNNPIFRSYFRREYKVSTKRIESKMKEPSFSEKACIHLFISKEKKDKLNRALKTKRPLLLYNVFVDAYDTLESKLENNRITITEEISKRYSKSLDEMPYLKLLKRGECLTLDNMSDKRLSDLYDELIFAYITAASLTDINGNEKVLGSDYRYKIAEKGSKINSIIDKIDFSGGLEKFMKYIKYFEYIEAGRELSEEKIIDISINKVLKNMIIKKEESSKDNS